MQKNNPNIQALILVGKKLGAMSDLVVVVGGCATGLLITDPAAPEIRVTQDVDIIVELATRKQYYDFSEQLKSKGFVEDQSAKVLCRWKLGNIIVDVMPTNADILGFSNPWYQCAIKHSIKAALSKEVSMRIVSPPYFVATKFEAFKGRGKKDFITSPDLEDIISVVDGRVELLSEIAQADEEVRTYLAKQCGALLKAPEFMQHVEGFMPSDAASQGRVPKLIARLKEIAGLV